MSSHNRRRTPLESTTLKTTLVIGSLLATYVGADLLAQQDLVIAAADQSETLQPQPQTIQLSSGPDGSPLELELNPIPDVVSADQIPRPVARSRSSG